MVPGSILNSVRSSYMLERRSSVSPGAEARLFEAALLEQRIQRFEAFLRVALHVDVRAVAVAEHDVRLGIELDVLRLGKDQPCSVVWRFRLAPTPITTSAS